MRLAFAREYFPRQVGDETKEHSYPRKDADNHGNHYSWVVYQ